MRNSGKRRRKEAGGITMSDKKLKVYGPFAIRLGKGVRVLISVSAKKTRR
jgi:hypothetical protein